MSIPTQLVGSIVTPSFILNSVDCNVYVLYLIASDVERQCANFTIPLVDDSRYVEISKLELVIHDGPYTSLEYRVTRGQGYRLPRIIAAHNDDGGRRGD